MPEQSVSVEPTLEQKLETLVQQRIFCSQTAKPHQNEVDKLSDKIKRLMIDDMGELERVVEFNGKRYKVTVNPYAEKSTISRELLIQAGVAGEIVDACTVTTQFEKIDVREVKAND